MKRLFTLLASISLINAAIAAPVHQHPLPTNPAMLALFQQTQNAVHANVKPNQLNMDALDKAVRARHVALLKEWQAHNANSKLKGLMSDRIEQLLKQSSSSLEQSRMRMNILFLQTVDVLEMLISIQTAGAETMDILQKLYDDAVRACGALSSADRADLNAQLQQIIEMLPYYQSFSTLDGPKLLSAGNVRLQFGKELHADSTYLIKIPDFTREALGLTHLSLESTAQAQEAVAALGLAMKTVQTALVSVGTGYIDDAETMVFDLGFMLEDNFEILAEMRNLSLSAVSACMTSDAACGWYEMDLDYLKALMQKNQGYLSLNGMVNQGYGDLTIQIGNQVTPETTLTVHVPVTNAEMTGINDMHFQWPSDPFAAIRKANSVMREFTYGVQS